ncbi:putative disease resistance RPP13-like protein 1 isoform X1 [Sesamum indicum]|uniref:Disease resistance RPP13-like protein 1 isoform X1 n=1 Tax=Sesamum indicum TaxID=4182 RepID=A0A6I9SSF9_SESIN|nr:putative disease resistance RPP13-like protein 1 isoform X1 [Sesamum indicum]
MLMDQELSRTNVSVIPIVGMGGIGKTTLAQIVYNDHRLVGKFDLKMWASVSMDFDTISITKSIIESASGERCKLSGLDPIQVNFQNLIRGKKFLLVLDDYWSEEYRDWDLLCSPFKVGARGSMIIVTTRSTIVSRILGSVPSYCLKSLNDENCWELMKRRACANRILDNDLQIIGRMIATKCRGLPLAAKTLGSMLHFKDNPVEWRSILESEMWDLRQYKNDIFPALTLSYYYLPPQLKKCFTYCSIFPKNHAFEANELVLQWMAEGFIRPVGKIRPEDLGNDYFKGLLCRSLFQYSHVNVHGQNIYKMHDLIHDMAQLISAHACLRQKDNQATEECTSWRNTRHFSLHFQTLEPVILKGSAWYKNLRTFRVIHENFGNIQVSYDLFLKLKALRVLDLSRLGLDELPDSIDHLKHLRYLNLSENHFRKLPESVTHLFGLQTLKLEQCLQLLELPSKMKNMVSLRHLHLDVKQLNCMPSEFGKLVNLQSLPAYIVGRSRGCGIRELKNMRLLRGSICIKNLENVSNVNEAKEAMLDRKPFLDKLELEWNDVGPNNNGEEILAGLRPHENLKELVMINYGGFLLPSWFGNPLCKLSSIYLQSCHHQQILAPLGKLRHLKSLIIEDMCNLSHMGPEFDGFSSLESLTIKDMPNLTSWSGFNGGCPCLSTLDINDCPRLTNLPSFMNINLLRCLNISLCPEIHSLPHDGLPVSLQALTISESDHIKDRCRIEEGEDWYKIRSIPKIEIDYVEITWEMRRF